MSGVSDGDLDRIETHARGGLPEGDGELYVNRLVAEVRRLRGAADYFHDVSMVEYGIAERAKADRGRLADAIRAHRDELKRVEAFDALTWGRRTQAADDALHATLDREAGDV